jgi:hypothetical protein
MKLDMYIIAPEPISMAYFINPSHQSVCVSTYRCQATAKILPRQRIHMRRFLCGLCRTNKSRRLVLPRTSCSLSFCHLSLYMYSFSRLHLLLSKLRRLEGKEGIERPPHNTGRQRARTA